MPGTTFTYSGRDRVPGIDTNVFTFENEFLFGPMESQYITALIIDGVSSDAGNTVAPHILRSGLLLGQNLATTKLHPWDPTALDGTEYIFGILNESRSMHAAGVDTDRLTGPMVLAGGLLSNRLIIPGNVGLGIVGDPLEFEVRRQLQENFKLNDSYQFSRPSDSIHIVSAAEEAGGITLVGTDTRKEYHATGAVTIVLPTTPFKGQVFTFFGNAATITVNSGSVNIKTPGVALANTLAVLDEINQLVGTGTEWLVRAL